MKRRTPAQRRILDKVRAGARLTWFGCAGPELEGQVRPPQKRTVRALIAAGALEWQPYRNATQKGVGICDLQAAPLKGIGP